MPGSHAVTVIGRYALHDEIASGGMATVHLGRLLGPVGFARTVAIKRLHQHYAKDPDFVSMFLDEARLAARIRHPNVVPTLDVVSLSGELFLVMDYVHGVSLSGVWRALNTEEGRIPVDIACTVMVGALHGLHAAHEARDERGQPLGIVHRDVSPQNIMVGSDGLPRVLDFGVAKASWRIQTTRDGQVKGKLSYMAPEQVNGGLVGPWTDVYAAGIVLWEALANERLFKGSDSGAVLARFTHNTPVAPPSTYNSEVSPELDVIVLRALHSDSEQRFESAQDMADAIEATVQLASNSAVARWVRSVAHEELALHAALIADIEHGSTVSSVPTQDELAPARKFAAELASSPRTLTTITKTSETVIQASGEHTSRSQISMTRSPSSSEAPGPRRGKLYQLSLAAAVLAAVLALLFVVERARPKAETLSAPAALSLPATPLLPLPASSAPPIALTATASPTPTVKAEDLPTAPKPAAARVPKAVAQTAAPVAPASAQPSLNCEPPYIVDSRGVRHMKLACIR